MLEVITKCFPQQIKAWEPKIKQMIPAYGMSLSANPKLLNDIHASAAHTLGLTNGTDGHQPPAAVNHL